MELEGREVVVEARIECELPPDTRCHVTCQQHEVQIKSPGWAEVPWPRALYQPHLAVPHSSQPHSDHVIQGSPEPHL